MNQPAKNNLVLVVDDEPTVLSVTQHIVRRAGFATLAASGGLEAIALLEAHCDEVCCVLLDMSMPEMDGAQTFRELRRIRPDLVVILVSGFNGLDLGTEFGPERPFAFLQKPFSIGQLDDLLRAAVRSTAGRPGPEKRSADDRVGATTA